MDFTIDKYKALLQAAISAGYTFQTFEEFLKAPEKRSIILRHDVDLRPKNSLRFAEIQHQFGVKGVYYFRAVPESWDEGIILAIKNMRHEIGYHYECLTTTNGNMSNAITDFKSNLAKLRQLAPVSTICMHGSPMSKYDSKDLWKHANYREEGIIGEPYFDVDFGKVFYLTDTGMSWNGEKFSVRDKVKLGFTKRYETTDDIIQAFGKKELPDQIMFTFHPQRWNQFGIIWLQEFVFQKIKNTIKYFLARK